MLVLGAAALAVDAVERDRTDLGWCAGALAGLAGLVRIDSLREIVLLLPLCALLALRGSRAAVPMALGALGGTLLAAVPAVAFSRPYLDLNRSSLLPLVALAVVVTALSALLLAVARRRAAGRPARPRPPGRLALALPWICGGLVALAWAGARRPAGADRLARAGRRRGRALRGLAAAPAGAARGRRPHLRRAEPDLGGAGTLGWPAIVLAAAAFTVLSVLAARWWVARDAATRPPSWLVPAGVGLGSTLLTLYRPGITPDHPWADRRLVVTVLPSVVLAAVAAVAWAVRKARRRAPAPVFVLTAVAGVAVLVVPPLLATVPVAGSATERGEARAVADVCAGLTPSDVVVALPSAAGGSTRATNEWPQVVRGVCGVPAASLFVPRADLPGSLDRLAALAAGAGHRLVVLAADDADAGDVRAAREGPPLMRQLGVRPTRVTHVVTREEPRRLTRPAGRTVPLLVEVWTAPWPARS